ncbi:hypothetical protein GQX73_g4883 [Xylaria multiplex]|uniref:Myb-like domain-containing protein n=1 Tax=Xylaria multiplex TaxID=323545 RepID=A0A7C8IRX1_9PEZI|nr:hypothetical protein GQX73_g4883 [Xylaria multiplex]
MGAPRTRAASRREETPEQPREGPVTRQTRSASKRAETSDLSPQSKSIHREPKFPQRGIRRRRRRSLESVATDDFPKSSVGYASPEPSSTVIPESIPVEDMAASNTESQDDSYEDRAARLQDILDFDLPKLSRWCERAYEALFLLTNTEPTSEERKKLNMISRSFKMARRALAEDGATYIDLSSSDLPYRDDPNAHTTILQVTRSANLISLLLSLADLKRSKQTILPLLQELDGGSLNLLDPYPSAQPNSQSLAFLIRCSRLVESLGEEPMTEPLILATTLFCEKSAETVEEAIERLRTGPFREFGSTERGGNFMSSEWFKTHMDKLISGVSLSGRDEAKQALSAMFPQDDTIEDLWIWALVAYEYVNQKVEESKPPINDQEEGETNDGAEREVSEGLPVGGNDQSDEDIEPRSSSEEGDYNQLQLAKEPSFIQNSAALAAVRRSERGDLRRTTVEQVPNQENARGGLMDRQIRDAIRRLKPSEILGPSDSGDEIGGIIVLPNTRAMDSHSRSPSQELGATEKRTHTREDEDYVDEDDGFEVDERAVDGSRRNQREDSDVPRPAPKRSKFSNLSKNRDRPQPLENPRATTNLTERDIATLSQVARANKLANKLANKGRGHQVRERWSDVDTDRLLDLIANQDLNCSWARMQEEGGFQTYRNQQAIRDKARNLKKGYLCADAILPSGFDFVCLGKKEKDEVIASGRNPDRSENDIDENGRVIHHLWRETPD